ncbi:hypothetical protein AB0H20_27830 [Nocardia fluminea]|uniref:hypothetical protein n=1 Tax=Nocardia fluminea TaxID=134984 RepID=UPI0033F566B6
MSTQIEGHRAESGRGDPRRDRYSHAAMLATRVEQQNRQARAGHSAFQDNIVQGDAHVGHERADRREPKPALSVISPNDRGSASRSTGSVGLMTLLGELRE